MRLTRCTVFILYFGVINSKVFDWISWFQRVKWNRAERVVNLYAGIGNLTSFKVSLLYVQQTLKSDVSRKKRFPCTCSRDEEDSAEETLYTQGSSVRPETYPSGCFYSRDPRYANPVVWPGRYTFSKVQSLKEEPLCSGKDQNLTKNITVQSLF